MGGFLGGLLWEIAFYSGHISFFYGTGLKLRHKGVGCFGGFGDEHEAGGESVETVACCMCWATIAISFGL